MMDVRRLCYTMEQIRSPVPRSILWRRPPFPANLGRKNSHLFLEHLGEIRNIGKTAEPCAFGDIVFPSFQEVPGSGAPQVVDIFQHRTACRFFKHPAKIILAEPYMTAHCVHRELLPEMGPEIQDR